MNQKTKTTNLGGLELCNLNFAPQDVSIPSTQDIAYTPVVELLNKILIEVKSEAV